MRDPNRGTGRTTKDLERALARLREGHSVLFLVNQAQEIPYVVGLLQKHGAEITRVNLSRGFVTIAGRNMYFGTNTRPEYVRGWRMENVFTDHHFYEGIRWSDWEWFWQLRH